MKMEIKRLGLLSVIKICFVLCFILGIFIGLLWAFILMIFGNMFAAALPVEANIGKIGLISIVVFPLLSAFFYAFTGSFFGLIAAVFYNIAAGLIGGLEVEIDTKDIDKLSEPERSTEEGKYRLV